MYSSLLPPPEVTVAFTQSTGDVIRGDPTLSLNGGPASYRTLSPTVGSPDTTLTRKLAGSISRTSHLQLLCQVQRDLSDLARVRYASGSYYIASVLSPPALAKDLRLVKYYTLAFSLYHHARCSTCSLISAPFVPTLVQYQITSGS